MSLWLLPCPATAFDTTVLGLLASFPGTPKSAWPRQAVDSQPGVCRTPPKSALHDTCRSPKTPQNPDNLTVSPQCMRNLTEPASLTPAAVQICLPFNAPPLYILWRLLMAMPFWSAAAAAAGFALFHLYSAWCTWYCTSSAVTGSGPADGSAIISKTS
mgnify:CR=1 FL=1